MAVVVWDRYFVFLAQYDRRDIMFPGCPSVRPSVRPPVTLSHRTQQKLCFYALHYQHDSDVHLLFCFDLDLHITSLGRVYLTWIFFFDPHWWVPLTSAAPSKSHAFSVNCHAGIAMPTWRRCAPPILFWPWPPYNLLLRSCLTLIFFVDSHWWVPFCLQCPSNSIPFWQIIMYILQCPHDIHVHLFCFDLHTFNVFLLRSHAATCPTSNCGRRTSLLRQEIVCHYFCIYWKHFYFNC